MDNATLKKICIEKIMHSMPALEPNWVEFSFVRQPQQIFIFPANLYTAALFFGVQLPKPIETDKQLNLSQYGFPNQFLWFRSRDDYGHSHQSKYFLTITI